MNSTAEDIKTILDDIFNNPSDSYFYDSGEIFELYPMFIGKEPAEPANTLSIFETMGGLPQLTFNRDEVYLYNSVQIRVRSTSYVEGWKQVERIFSELHGRAGILCGSTLYTLIQCSSGPALLDYDKNQRVRFIINFNCQRRQN